MRWFGALLLPLWLFLVVSLWLHPYGLPVMDAVIDSHGPGLWLLAIAGLFSPPFKLLWRLLAIGAVGLMNAYLGHGYNYKWPMTTAVVLIVAGALLYGAAAEQRVFVPSSKILVHDLQARRLCAGVTATAPPPPLDQALDWVRCQRRIDGLTPFNAWLYSLDQMTPTGALGQRANWEPDALKPLEIALPGLKSFKVTGAVVDWARTMQYYLALFLYAILGAFIAGRIKKE